MRGAFFNHVYGQVAIIIVVVVIIIIVIITLALLFLLLLLQIALELLLLNSQTLLHPFLLLPRPDLSSNHCYDKHREDGVKRSLFDNLGLFFLGQLCLVIVESHFVSEDNVPAAVSLGAGISSRFRLFRRRIARAGAAASIERQNSAIIILIIIFAKSELVRFPFAHLAFLLFLSLRPLGSASAFLRPALDARRGCLSAFVFPGISNG
mmetsp:Transcript_11452/g.24843  ORF Transcript_11452/g.24843 Transcript_11452/m.24843 type:complete len:208 (-) Transcript_11452:657-1280(-)